MKYRSVGKSGLKISEVALGSWVTDLKGTAAENVTNLPQSVTANI